MVPSQLLFIQARGFRSGAKVKRWSAATTGWKRTSTEMIRESERSRRVRGRCAACWWLCSNPPRTSWRWSCSEIATRWWRNDCGSEPPKTGSYIPAAISGEFGSDIWFRFFWTPCIMILSSFCILSYRSLVISLPSYALSIGSLTVTYLQSSDNYSTLIPSQPHLCSTSSQYSLLSIVTLARPPTSSSLKTSCRPNGRNRTVPPCIVGRRTGHAPGPTAVDRPRALQTTTPTDDSMQNNTGTLGGPLGPVIADRSVRSASHSTFVVRSTLCLSKNKNLTFDH